MSEKKSTKTQEKRVVDKTQVVASTIEDRLAKAQAYLKHVDAVGRNPKSKMSTYKIGLAKDMLESVERVPTDIPSLDILLNGGIPKGKVVVIYGEKGVTKTNVVYEIEKAWIKRGLLPVRNDIEQQDDDQWLNQIQLPTDKHLITRENRFDVIWDCIIEQIDYDTGDLYIVDSLDAALHTNVEKGSVGDDHMTLTARKLSQIVFPKLLKRLADTKKTVIIVCQYRMEFSSGGASDLGSYSGGNALKHDSSLDLWVRRVGKSSLRGEGARFKSGDLSLGFGAGVKVMKSKLWGVRETSMLAHDFYFGKGIDPVRTMFETAWKLKLTTQSGSKYTIVDPTGKEIISGLGYEDIISKLDADKNAQEKTMNAMMDTAHGKNSSEVIVETEDPSVTGAENESLPNIQPSTEASTN